MAPGRRPLQPVRSAQKHQTASNPSIDSVVHETALADEAIPLRTAACGARRRLPEPPQVRAKHRVRCSHEMDARLVRCDAISPQVGRPWRSRCPTPQSQEAMCSGPLVPAAVFSASASNALRPRPSIEAAHAVATVSLGNVECAVRAREHRVGRTIFVSLSGRDTDTGSHFDIRPGRLLERATQWLGASLRHSRIHTGQHDAEFLTPETGGSPSWPIWSRMMAAVCTSTRSPAG